jgi:hypothetical protein
MGLHPTEVADPGYSLRPYPNRCFEYARGTKPSWRVRKDFRAAFAANSDYSDHCPRLGVRLHLVLRKILLQLTPDLRHEFHEFAQPVRQDLPPVKSLKR